MPARRRFPVKVPIEENEIFAVASPRDRRKKRTQVMDPWSNSDKAKEECAVCWEREWNMVLDPCGHTYCDYCVKKLVECPICRVVHVKAIQIRPV